MPTEEILPPQSYEELQLQQMSRVLDWIFNPSPPSQPEPPAPTPEPAPYQGLPQTTLLPPWSELMDW